METVIYETLYHSVIVFGLIGHFFWLPVHFEEFRVFGAIQVYRLTDYAIRVDFPCTELGVQFRDWCRDWSYLGWVLRTECIEELEGQTLRVHPEFSSHIIKLGI